MHSPFLLFGLVGCGNEETPIADGMALSIFSEDVHKITNANESGLIKKYTVFQLSVLLKGSGDYPYRRKINFLEGLSSIEDTFKYDSSRNFSEIKATAQKVFDDFSKTHGIVISEKTQMIPSKDYRGEIKHVSYEFKKENGYTPLLAFNWSDQVFEGDKYYTIEVKEMHYK